MGCDLASADPCLQTSQGLSARAAITFSEKGPSPSLSLSCHWSQPRPISEILRPSSSLMTTPKEFPIFGHVSISLDPEFSARNQAGRTCLTFAAFPGSVCVAVIGHVERSAMHRKECLSQIETRSLQWQLTSSTISDKALTCKRVARLTRSPSLVRVCGRSARAAAGRRQRRAVASGPGIRCAGARPDCWRRPHPHRPSFSGSYRKSNQT